MTPSSPLLAKSWTEQRDPPRQVTLLGHSEQVATSFHRLFGGRGGMTRLGHRWLRFFRVDDNASEAFCLNGLIACWLHDLGKANSGFQETARGKSGCQVIRHEHLSGLILTLPEMVKWFAASPELSWPSIVTSIVGHHLKADRNALAGQLLLDRRCFQVHLQNAREVLVAAATALDLPSPPRTSAPALWTFEPGGIVWDLKSDLVYRLERFQRDLRTCGTALPLLLAIRAALIVADAAGSGLARVGAPASEWLYDAFDEEDLVSATDVEKGVIAPRIGQVEQSGKPFAWSDFQTASEGLPNRALLLAPCGSGKTLAAWKWIMGQLRGSPTKRVVFLYPTRATATEGFRDYVSWAPEADAALMHGTSSYELEGLFENPDDDRHGRDFTTDDRLFAIGYWQRRIFSATVDQFLGFMQNAYRSICLLPVLVDSVIVIDEVHSFDRSLFAALKRFLETFNVPVLCMTASLPRERQTDLVERGLHLFPSQTAQFDDLEAVAAVPRYVVNRLKNATQAREVALKAHDSGRRVLWVVNTVDRCQALARELGSICYHSRFRLCDRKRRHEEVIHAFKQRTQAYLAVTTQVCEMSLDLDADVLITEEAPITSLIQRMGRCNRRARPPEGFLGDVWVCVPETRAPYLSDDFDGVEEFLKAVDGKCVSQRDLRDLLDIAPGRVEPKRYAAFLECGPWAIASEKALRDEAGPTARCILDSDVEQYQDLSNRRCPTDGLILNVPWSVAKSFDRLHHGLCIAAASHYVAEYGFLKKSVENVR